MIPPARGFLLDTQKRHHAGKKTEKNTSSNRRVTDRYFKSYCVKQNFHLPLKFCSLSTFRGLEKQLERFQGLKLPETPRDGELKKATVPRAPPSCRAASVRRQMATERSPQTLYKKRRSSTH